MVVVNQNNFCKAACYTGNERRMVPDGRTGLDTIRCTSVGLVRCRRSVSQFLRNFVRPLRDFNKIEISA